MKKAGVGLLGLGFALFLLPGCPGGGDDGGGGAWLGAQVARSVDQQFGPVTVVDSALGEEIALGGGGSHQAVDLRGKVSDQTVISAVQFIMEQWLPGRAMPLPEVPLPCKPLGGNCSKLSAEGEALSVDSDPCRQDSDNDGTPDVQEPRCDPVDDPHCFGLCVNPEVDTVECRSGEFAFTIKFSDCQVNSDPWVSTWIYTGVVNSWTTITTSYVATDECWSTFSVVGLASACTNTTVNGTVAKILAWDTVLDTVNGVPHDTVMVKHGTTTTIDFCAFWNPTSSVTTTPAFLDTVECAAGIYADLFTTCSPATSDTFTVTQRIIYPYDPSPTGTTLGSSQNPVEVLINGSVTRAMGGGGVDEQLIHTRYDNLTQVWDTDGLGMLDNPFVTYNGQSLQYRVLDSIGNQDLGTTWGGRAKDAPIGPIQGQVIGEDRMLLENRRVKMDMDGVGGSLWEEGEYDFEGGFDNEDYFFLFTHGNNIVSWNDKNGSREVVPPRPMPDPVEGFGGWRLVGVSETGNPIYALSFYEQGNGEDDRCSVPQNKTPCLSNVEVDPKLRTLSVLSIRNCQGLDEGAMPELTNVVF